MVTLYYKPTCPYCQRVLAANEQIKAPLKLRNVLDDVTATQELREKGGKSQVPFLVDDERNTAMYESADIIAYLTKIYAPNAMVETTSVPKVCPIE